MKSNGVYRHSLQRVCDKQIGTTTPFLVKFLYGSFCQLLKMPPNKKKRTSLKRITNPSPKKTVDVFPKSIITKKLVPKKKKKNDGPKKKHTFVLRSHVRSTDWFIREVLIVMVQNQQLKVLIILVQAAFSVYMFTLLGWVVCGLDFCLVFDLFVVVPLDL